jgi:predicted enzyme related to lactoylglutathione lyase
MSKFEGNAITWFEIPTIDIDRATKFYETLLAAELLPFPGPEPCNMFPSGESAVGGCLVQRLHQKPAAEGTMVYLNVDGKLDDTLSRAASLNSTVLVPKTQIPGGLGFYACLLDTEGNHVGLHSR